MTRGRAGVSPIPPPWEVLGRPEAAGGYFFFALAAFLAGFAAFLAGFLATGFAAFFAAGFAAFFAVFLATGFAAFFAFLATGFAAFFLAGLAAFLAAGFAAFFAFLAAGFAAFFAGLAAFLGAAFFAAMTTTVLSAPKRRRKNDMMLFIRMYSFCVSSDSNDGFVAGCTTGLVSNTLGSRWRGSKILARGGEMSRSPECVAECAKQRRTDPLNITQIVVRGAPDRLD